MPLFPASPHSPPTVAQAAIRSASWRIVPLVADLAFSPFTTVCSLFRYLLARSRVNRAAVTVSLIMAVSWAQTTSPATGNDGRPLVVQAPVRVRQVGRDVAEEPAVRLPALTS
jgi:hypothetical protein